MIFYFLLLPHPNENYNIEHELKITRGILNEKFFIDTVLMLFKKYNEYYTNLVLDYECGNDNLKDVFCGFQFFVDVEWKALLLILDYLLIKEENILEISFLSTFFKQFEKRAEDSSMMFIIIFHQLNLNYYQILSSFKEVLKSFDNNNKKEILYTIDLQSDLIELSLINIK